MQIGVISLFPAMFDALEHGITGKALARGLLEISHWNPRDYTVDIHKKVDDRPYGGGPGMVLMYQPLVAAIEAAKQALGQDTRVVYLSAQGKPVKQSMLQKASQWHRLILLTGRYEGIDERVITKAVDEEWSLGDYVLSGGELAAMIIIDGITRLLPGALGDSQSSEQDSFSMGLLDCPHYTRPVCIENKSVPEILLSGDHQAIRDWRLQQALGRTWQRRPDLMEKYPLSSHEKQLLQQFIKNIIH